MRSEFRNNFVLNEKGNFVPPTHSVIHFDGKILSDLSGGYGDRLAIVISGNTPQCKSGFMISSQLISDGTGKVDHLSWTHKNAVFVQKYLLKKAGWKNILH